MAHATRWGRRPRAGRRLLLALAAVAAFLVGATAAQATISYYRTGTLGPYTVYNSVQRPDWANDFMNNSSASPVNERLWAYHPGVGYIFDNYPGVTVGAGQGIGHPFPAQTSTVWCQLRSDIAAIPGNCGGQF